MEQFERDGLVGPVEGPKPRRVLVTYEDYYGGQPDGIIEMSDEDTR